MTAEAQISPNQQPNPEKVLASGEALLHSLGIEIDPTKDPFGYIEAVRQAYPKKDDDRTVLRHKLQGVEITLSPEQVDLLHKTANAMRMYETETPLVGDFDVVIVMGAANHSNLDRARYAAEAIKAGKATARYLAIAGADRPLDHKEISTVRFIAPGASTELDLCRAASAYVGELTGVKFDVLGTKYEKGDGSRASTPDVVAVALATAEARGFLQPGSKVAAVTTQIYIEATRLDLARSAKRFGVHNIFVAGQPSDPFTVEKRNDAIYLREVLRTLRAAALSYAEQED